MIRVRPRPEPKNFDERCRKRGLRWLREHQCYKGRPYDYWSEFEPELRSAFDGLCGYCAMVIFKGQVDHFNPFASLRRHGRDQLAYEWSNFRYGEAALNQKKWTHKIMDPFKVVDGWFEILLPSLQLVLTPIVPTRKRKLAEFTLEKLGLRDDEAIVRYRQMWFESYTTRDLTIERLAKFAPLIARAVERDLARGIDWRK